MATIRVTPEELNTQGAELIAYAETLSATLDDVRNKIEEIIAGWDGLAQDAYYEMYSSMETTLKEFPTAVDSLGQVTQAAATAFSDLDETLKSSFSS